MAKSKIEWTEQTWNPIVGCSIVSPGCTNCYAMKQAAWIVNLGNAPQYDGTIQSSRKGPVWTGKMALAEKALLKPLKRRKPTTYFVNSMGDLFHEDVPDAWIDQVFAVMALCPQHTFQVLTKRADRMREYVSSDRRDQINAYGATLVDWADMEDSVGWPLPNVWLGVSAEDQTRADERISWLLDTPAAVRFVSCEPLLGPVDLTKIKCSYGDARTSAVLNALTGNVWVERPAIDLLDPRGIALDWVIVGGESGSNARPMHPDWARGLRDQCEAAGTAFFFKQWGEWGRPAYKKPSGSPGRYAIASADGNYVTQTSQYPRIFELFGGSKVIERVGKKAAGRLLDGREWDGMPG